jgi:pSer/pThr/pTyr-binding forkhead associated (FHA) protein
VIIECTSCKAKYQYGEERFEGKPSKKIKCARCQQIFEIHNPAFAAPEKPPVEKRLDGDATSTARPAPKPVDTTESSPLPESRRTDKHQPALQLPQGRRLSLAILDGPDAGTVVRIDKPRLTIGRSGADVTLNDSEASRQHALLEIRDLIITVSDLGSTNGTLVGGEKINEAVELSDKSEFQVGATTLMLIVTEEA